MILLEAGRTDERSFDSKLLFAADLAERGHRVVLDERTVPKGWTRHHKYDAAPFLAAPEDIAPASLVLIGAEDLTAETLARLRALDLPEDLHVVALGRFPDRQAFVAAQTRIAYAFGREPRVVDLEGFAAGAPAMPGLAPLTAPVRDVEPARTGPVRLLVFLPAEWLEEPQIPPLLAALDAMPRYRLSVVTPSAGKEHLRQTRHAALDVFGYADVLPTVLARHSDVAAFFGTAIPGERMAALAVDLLAAGKAVIDGTAGAAFEAWGAPVVRGPEEPSALPAFLDHAVIPNLAAIGRASRESLWIERRGIARLEAAAGLPSPPSVPLTDPAPGRIVFLPTNGNGLGHAQRCTRIAARLSRPDDALFLAFPSCLPLVRSRGFQGLPLVQKSPAHPEEYANDILNHLRLRRTLRPQDHLVFDGGYVFESIYRTILETGCRATWIRRGLWRPGQVASPALDRERVFSRILVPEEAFPELNVDYSSGARVHRVGPVVQPPPEIDRETVRARLSDHFGIAFDTLVVTMLGGGVAADRSAQLHTISGLLDARPRCLHLVVLWPTARLAPGIGAWRTTRLVRTSNALALMRAADATVSAVGYNTFHEVLYNRVPCIFIPQEAPYLDDQERRARAASDRDVAETVLAHELLLLERRLTDLLDTGGAAALADRLAALDLPPTGTDLAARLIEEETCP
jgi:hypothetical protein